MFPKARSLLSTVIRKRSYSEEALFSHTGGRWLYNNDAQLKARYAPFNVDGLKLVAASTNGSEVLSMTKIAESLNRIFLLTHQNGIQTIARIPTSLNGPKHLTIASEVATMDFLGRLGIPVPKVLAWSSHSESTEVESEFIIMEKAQGEPLSSIEWEAIDHADLGRKVAKMLRPLVETRFNCYGSIYYKSDFDGSKREDTVDDFLDNVPRGVDVSPFCIGPIARQDFWEDERASITEISHGPWRSALKFLSDTALREQIWIDRFAKPHLHDDFLCGLPFQGKQDNHIELLEYYKYLLPFLVPKEPRYLHGHLWHPDLHAANLFVVPSKDSPTQDGKIRLDITSCIDWQGAFVGPAFLQLTALTMYPDDVGSEALVLPPHFDTLDPETQKEVLRYHNAAVRRRLFETLAFGDLMLDDAHLPALSERRKLDALAQCTWRTGLLPFREAMIKVCKRFPEIAPGETCPVTFTPEELSTHAAAHAYWLSHRAHAEQLDQEFGLGEFGYVAGEDPAHFESVRRKVEDRRREWVGEATTEEGRRVMEHLWPYRDTLSDHPRTHLMLDVGASADGP